MSHATKLCALLLAAGLTLSACSNEPDGQGGMEGAPTSPTPLAVAADKPAAPTPEATPTESPEPPAAGVGADDDPEESETVSTAPAVGSATLNWEAPDNTFREFSFKLTKCSVGSGGISVEGFGSENATGAASTLTIATTPAELLHEGTGTFQAAGHHVFTINGDDVVADGRIHTGAEGFTGPSMFTYRTKGKTAEFRNIFWVGSAGAGGGATFIECET